MEFSRQAFDLYLFLLNTKPELITEAVKMMCFKYQDYMAIQKVCVNFHDLFQAVCLDNFDIAGDGDGTVMPWQVPNLIPMDQFNEKLRDGLKKFGLSQFEKFNDYIEKTHHLILLLEDQTRKNPQIELADPKELLEWRASSRVVTFKNHVATE